MGYQVIITMSELTFTQRKQLKNTAPIFLIGFIQQEKHNIPFPAGQFSF